MNDLAAAASTFSFGLEGTLLALVAAAILLGLALAAAAPRLSSERIGRLVLFVGLFALPGLLLLGGVEQGLHRATERSFCLGSCHEMDVYGQSLLVDDEEVIPAVHFQNHLVDPDHACYACHTDYTMFGGVKAKLRGMRHVWVHYVGTIPDDIELYEPFPNSSCLSCHRGARSFMTSRHHRKKDKPLDKILSGEVSCVSSGCHDLVHVIDETADGDFDLWEPIEVEPTDGSAAGDEEAS